MSYSDRIKCQSCLNGSGPNGCTDCLNTGHDSQAFAGGIEQALNDAYAEGRKDEAEERAADCAAEKLVDAWAMAKGKPVPWTTAVEIISIVQKIPEAEKTRLLALWDEA